MNDSSEKLPVGASDATRFRGSWLTPGALIQWLAGLVAGVWLSRQGEWAADWQGRMPDGAPESAGDVLSGMADSLLLPSLMLGLLVMLAFARRPAVLRLGIALWGGLLLGLVNQPLMLAEALAREDIWLEGRIEQASRSLPAPGESVRLVFRVEACRASGADGEAGGEQGEALKPPRMNASGMTSAGRELACRRLEGQRVQLRRYWPRRAASESSASPLLVPWQAGERWRLIARLVPPHAASNPDALQSFDRVSWWWREGIVATGYVRDPARAQRLAPPRGVAALRLAAEQRLWQGCGGRGDDVQWAHSPCRWLAALTLGRASALTRDDWESLNATGLTHLAVVSGLHVGLMASLVLVVSFGVLRRLRPADWRFSVAPWWLACLAAWSFAILAGLAPPALRAALMTSVGLWMASGRSGLGVWQIWMLALSLVIGLDPLALWRPGTWYSFLAVAALLLAWQGCERPRGALGWCRATLRSQWVLTLVMGVALLVGRGQLSWLAMPMNLVIAPLATLLVVPLGMLGWGLAGIDSLLDAMGLRLSEGAGMSGALWQWLAERVDHGMAWLGAVTQRHGLWPVRTATDTLSADMAAAMAMMVLGGLWLASGVPGLERRVRGLCTALAMLWGTGLALLLWPPAPWPSSAHAGEGRTGRDSAWLADSRAAPLVVTVHDVGQGLAISLRVAGRVLSPETMEDLPRHWLYDLGPGAAFGPPRMGELLKAAEAPWGVIISHGDGDHAGGLAALRAEQVAQLWVPEGQRNRLDRQVGWLKDVPTASCEAGRRITLGHLADRPVKLEMLWPPPGWKVRRDNAHSCVVLITWGERPLALLSGDIGVQEERQLVELLSRRLAGSPLPLLVVAHHGSRSSSGESWLARLAPRHAIISAGRYNPHGHPHDEVVERLMRHAQCVWHSGLEGALRWEWSPDAERLIPARGAAGIDTQCLGVKSVD
ncbi:MULTISPECIES: ComEC/Rec2 family competence protein [Cobetia]|uniref:ComEC/Rec2 family competence protein n=1 Tax=Cobetia TaxID=204286 RepID=UPI000985AC80|nr:MULTISPECIES: ComEC/Rec2 family competence protein [Cobetia]